MNQYGVRIQAPEGRVKEILERLNAAQETILQCYHELHDIGVLTFYAKDEETPVTDSRQVPQQRR